MSGRNGGSLVECLAIPGETVASECRCVAGVAVTDGQMQGDDRVATRCVGEGMGRSHSGSLGVISSIPIEAVASERRCVTSVTMAYGQMQRYHRIATRSIDERMCGGYDRSLGISSSIPCKTVACECCRVASVTTAYSQMQRYHRVATRSIDERMCRGYDRSLVICSSIPCETVAGESGGVTGVAVANGQMQSDDRVATRGVGESMCRSNSRSLGVCLAIPSKAVACEGGGVTSVAMTDGQMKGDDRVATRGVDESMRGRNGRSLVKSLSIPSEAVASKGGGVTSVAVTDSQVESDDGVTTRGVSEGMGRCDSGCLIECLAVPCKTVAGECGCITSVAVTDGQMQCHHGVTPRSIGESLCRSYGRCLIERLAIPGEAVAGKDGGVTSIAVTNGQMQRNHRVTPRSVGESMRRSNIGSFIIGCSIPCETVASKSSSVTSVAVANG